MEEEVELFCWIEKGWVKIIVVDDFDYEELVVVIC